tara:strand:+ start:344 stop:583 length:240 start_codon:yes stop_codon:yes gene_type:complete
MAYRISQPLAASPSPLKKAAKKSAKKSAKGKVAKDALGVNIDAEMNKLVKKEKARATADNVAYNISRTARRKKFKKLRK